MIDYYSKPILTARETARCLGMPESTLDVWLLDSGKTLWSMPYSPTAGAGRACPSWA